jgi:predicted AAA+ superfamily ATPase
MRNDNYRSRVVDKKLEAFLKAFGGVLVVGPKWCGKSWTASNQAGSEVFIDIEDNKRRALLIPELILDGPEPRLIDEWQDAPVLWDAARRKIDMEHRPGMLIFTGSAVPDIPDEKKPSHTGTGRFARLRMRTLSLYEQNISNGKVSLSALFDGIPLQPCASEMDFSKALHLICNGGWPASFWIPDDNASMIASEYLNMVISEDISRVDGIKKDAALVRLFIRSLARNSATTVKATSLKADVALRDETDISEQTIRSYYEALKKIFIIEEQDAWTPSLRSRSRIRSTPKRHFADPSLAAAALGATPGILAGDLKTAGFLFESLCFRDLSVYTDALDGRVYHYRDKDDLEADIILQLPDGKWSAIEVKLGTFEFDDAANNLLKLKKKLTNETAPPSFLAIVTASGGMAWQRDDGVLVIPIDCLSP